MEKYGTLKADIEGKMWALKELKNAEELSNEPLHDSFSTENTFSE